MPISRPLSWPVLLACSLAALACDLPSIVPVPTPWDDGIAGASASGGAGGPGGLGGLGGAGGAAEPMSPLTLVWSRSFEADASVKAYGVALLPGGGLVVAGEVKGGIDFGTGPLEPPDPQALSGFLAAFDWKGAALWSRRIGGSSGGAGAVAVDHAGGVIAAGRGEILPGVYPSYVARLTHGGKVEWAKKLAFTPHALAIDSHDRIAVLAAAGLDQLYLGLFDASGKRLAERTVTGGPHRVSAVAANGSGSVALVGAFRGTLDLGVGPMSAAGDHDALFVALGASCDGVLHVCPPGCTEHAQCGDESYCDLATSSCVPRLANGYLCDAAVHCQSGQCIDGRCCDGPCGGTCESCALAGTEGTCTPIPYGEDPEEECPAACDGAAACAAGGGHRWARLLAGTRALTIALDSKERVLAAAVMQKKIDLGAGPLEPAGGSDILLAAFDADGAHLWSKRFGGPGPENAPTIAIDAADSIYLGGTSAGGIDFGPGLPACGTSGFLVKLSPAGEPLWSRCVGGQVHGMALAVDALARLLVAGGFSGAVDLGGGALPSAGGTDFFLGALAASGAHLWSKRFGDASDQCDVVSLGCRELALAPWPGGRVALTASFAGSVDLGAGVMKSAGSTDVLIGALEPDGALAWSKQLGGASKEVAGCARVDSQKRLLLAGGFSSAIDFGGGNEKASLLDPFLVAYGEQGAFASVATFSGASPFRGLAIAPDDTAVLVGEFMGKVDFGGGVLKSHPDLYDGGDGFVVRMTASGQHVWSQRFGGTKRQAGSGVAVAASGNVYVSGTNAYYGELSFGAQLLAGDGELILAFLP